jgi:hypothetical protein
MLTDLPLGLGLVPTVLALAALGVVGRIKPRAQGEVAVLAVTLLICAGLSVQVTDLIWAGLPMLQVVHYPWRFLALAAFAEGLLVGYAAEGLIGGWGARAEQIALGTAALILLLIAVPFLYPLPGDNLPANPTLATVTAYQQRSGALGSTSNSEFLPRGLTTFPSGPPFPGADQGATLGQKLDPASVPPSTTVRAVADGQLAARLAVDSPMPFTARFWVFRFPGWTASVDGQPVTLGAPGPDQTLTVPIPAGRHVVALVFGETILDLLSAGAAIGIVGLGLTAALQRRRTSPRRDRRASLDPSRSRRSAISSRCRTGRWSGDATVVGLLAAALLGVGLKWAVFDRTATPLVRPFDGTSPPRMAVAARHQFGTSLDLLGFTVDPAVGKPGQPVTLTLYWETRAPLAINYSSFVHFLDPTGRTVAGADNVHVADFPTTRWRLGAYARDIHRMALPFGLVPASYRVEIGVYDRATGTQLSVDGQASDYLILPPLAAASGGGP